MRDARRTVLILDDEAIIRQSLADYFEDHLWGACQAENAEEALRLVGRESPRGVVVDIRLQGMDGDSFIREAYKRRPKLAFVVWTGSPEYELPDDLAKLPNVCNRVFRKPVGDMAEMEKSLLRLISNLETGEAPHERGEPHKHSDHRG